MKAQAPVVKSNRERFAEMEAALPQRAKEALQLTELYYPATVAAEKLGIKKNLLYKYLNDPELHIEAFWEGRTRLVWADDIEHIWVMRHTIRRPHASEYEPARIPSPGEAQPVQDNGPRLVVRTA